MHVICQNSHCAQHASICFLLGRGGECCAPRLIGTVCRFSLLFLRACRIQLKSWIHKTDTSRGKYRIDWTTEGSGEGLLHYALPHQQVVGVDLKNQVFGQDCFVFTTRRRWAISDESSHDFPGNVSRMLLHFGFVQIRIGSGQSRAGKTHKNVSPQKIISSAERTGISLASPTKGDMELLTGTQWVFTENDLPVFDWAPSKSEITDDQQV